VKPAAFDYAAPTDLGGVLASLEVDGARLLAGGQSLVPLLNMRLARPSLLVDLRRVPDLDGLALEGGVLRVGAMMRQRRLEDDPRTARACPLLAAALPWIGHPQTRNRGTVGGSLCHADPSAELPVVAVALGAEMVLQGRGGRRSVPAADFFLGYLTADVRPGEVLVEVRFPEEASPSAFLEVSRRNGDFALVAVAVRRDPPVVVVGGASGVPARLAGAEQALQAGESPQAVGEVAAGEVDPDSDLHASAQYRREATAALVARAVERVRAA
jgi:carbon-monoxide dehydrogenase medium subunit